MTNIEAFDGNMTKGYCSTSAPYLATFSFRNENVAPPYKIWVPQFNRGCQDLMQAKCVLVDPKLHNIDVQHVSPCFIHQKGRAKHKKLEEWSS